MRRIKVYDDVELLEVSPVGIPSYPEAINRSLIKSIMSKMAEEEVSTDTQTSDEEEKTETTEKPAEETQSTEEKTEEGKTEEGETEEGKTEEKSSIIQMSKAQIQELITGIVKEVQADRKGLVEKQEEEQKKEDVEKMSAGEIMQKLGFFDTNKGLQTWG